MLSWPVDDAAGRLPGGPRGLPIAPSADLLVDPNSRRPRAAHRLGTKTGPARGDLSRQAVSVPSRRWYPAGPDGVGVGPGDPYVARDLHLAGIRPGRCRDERSAPSQTGYSYPRACPSRCRGRASGASDPRAGASAATCSSGAHDQLGRQAAVDEEVPRPSTTQGNDARNCWCSAGMAARKACRSFSQASPHVLAGRPR